MYALVGAGIGAGVGLYFAIQQWTAGDMIVSPTMVIGAPMLLGALVGGVIGLAVEASRN